MQLSAIKWGPNPPAEECFFLSDLSRVLSPVLCASEESLKTDMLSFMSAAFLHEAPTNTGLTENKIPLKTVTCVGLQDSIALAGNRP